MVALPRASWVGAHGGQLHICNETETCEGANLTTKKAIAFAKASAARPTSRWPRTSEGSAGGGGAANTASLAVALPLMLLNAVGVWHAEGMCVVTVPHEVQVLQSGGYIDSAASRATRLIYGLDRHHYLTRIAMYSA